MEHDTVLIVDQRELDGLCARCGEAGAFAFDTEFIRDDTFDATLCLVQIACEDEVWLVDPLASLDLSGFWKLLCDPEVVKIVHAGKEDCELCLRACDSAPRNIFDVQIAAGFVGLSYPLSLARLVEAIVGKRIIKGQTLTDWSRRPLTEDQIRYARDDVAFLPTIYQSLHTQLLQRRRLDWAKEEFLRFENAAFYQPPPEDRLAKFKGAKKLDGQGLAILSKLIGWREEWAKQKNRPLRALIRDDMLVEIARRKPTKATQLEVLRGFPQAKNPRVIEQILACIREASSSPRSSWPQPEEQREDSPMTKAVLDILSAFTRAVCHAEHVDKDLVGSAQRLRDLMDYELGWLKTPPTLLSGWREEFIGKRLVDLLEGRSELHLSGWPDHPRLDIVKHAVAKGEGASPRKTKKSDANK